MEQENRYAALWLKKRKEQPAEEPDIDYVTMLQELCRGQQ